MAAYHDLDARCEKIDRRETNYRFDLERDPAWDAIALPGVFFGRRFADALGLEARAARDPRFQWALALATCEEFIALERVILHFVDGEANVLGPRRSVRLLVEEEEKHIALFQRWAAHLRAREPALAPRFDAAFAASARLVGHLDSRECFPDEPTYHYLFWLNTLFFEEYTVWLHKLLAADATSIQPAWLAAHAAHRREEEQHLVTDAAHLDAVALDAAARATWSKAFFVRLADSFGRFFGLEAARRVLADVDRVAARALTVAPIEATPFYEALVRGPEFRRTRAHAPYLARLEGAPRTAGARLRALVQRAKPQSRRTRYRPAANASASAVAPASETEALVREAWAEALGVTPADIGPDVSFLTLGGDSMRAVEVHGHLERALSRTLDHRVLVECRTVREMTRFLERLPSAAAAEARPRVPTADDAVVIVSAAGRFPGASDLSALWSLLASGRSAIAKVPLDRWDADSWRTASPPIVCTTGGFLDDVRGFDPESFGLVEADAIEMDPQQRLFLEVAADALDQVGGNKRRTGVFAGAGWNHYFLRYTEDQRRIGPRSALGNLENMVAARVAQTLGLTGPALTVNAACASSLVAIHFAARALRARECDVALAGGVELNLTPMAYLLFGQAGVLSPEGRCRPFARDASGLVPGEGAGVVALKTLSRARADGDRILAVVRGSASNNDGGALSGLAPSPEGQLDVLRQAWAETGLSPADADYVEAHGTGTPVGDPIEARALDRLLAEHGARPGRCRLGSVKGNVGHLFNAAGVIGVIKVLLAFERGALPPSIGAEDPDPRIVGGLLRPVSVLEPFPALAGRPRRAGVSAFGVGGTNCHVVLEEPPVSAAPAPARDVALLCLSAPSNDDLRRVSAQTRAALDGGTPLESLAAGLSARRSHAVRRAVVAAAAEDARASLDDGAGTRAGGRPRVCFVLSGPGAQYPGMGHHLFDEPTFAAALARCASRLDARLPRPLRELMFDPLMDRIDVTQPVTFAFGFALAEWLAALGLRPDALIGHSAGEYLAACLAGVLDLDDALDLVVARGAHMAVSPPGGMAAVLAPEERVAPLLGPDLGVAAINEPWQIVISGARQALEAACVRLEAEGVTVRRLPISCAGHSPLMADTAARFAEDLAQVRFRAPSLPVYSTVTGDVGAKFDAAYFGAHLEQPVSFLRAVQSAARDGFTTFLEVGPGGALAPALGAILGDGSLAIPVLRRSVPGWAPTLEALGRLFEAGCDIDAYRGRPRAVLPPYPYRRRAFWLGADAAASLTEHPAVRDHQVQGRPIAPAALLLAHTGARALADVVIARPLPGVPGRRVEVRRDGDEVRIESAGESHLTGRVVEPGAAPAPLDLAGLAAALPDEVTAGTLYAHLEASGLTYGPSMRTVSALRAGPGEVLASLVPVDPAAGSVALVDGAMQAIAALTLGRESGTFLGFSIGRARFFDELPGPSVAHVRLASPLEPGAESFRVQVTIASPEGRVLAAFDDVALKRLHDPAPPRVYAVRLEPAVPGRERNVPGSVGLFGGPSPLAEAIVRRLEEGGVAATQVTLPPRRCPDEVIAVEPTAPELLALAQALDPARALGLTLVTTDGACAGYALALSAEHPAWRCRTIVVSSEEPARVASRVCAEWRTEPAARVVHLDDERRAPLLRPLDAPPAHPLREGGVYLITGGLGGIGRALARRLARSGARVVLTGRRDAGDAAFLAETGAHYVRADAADHAQMEAAFAAAVSKFGALHGVIHAAGILDDGLIRGRTAERQRAVLAGKIGGARVLIDLARGRDLDFIAFLSSLAGLFPSPGQTDYAFANAGLDALARAVGHVRVVSIDLGPFRDVGMVAGRRFDDAGIEPIPADPGAAAILDAIQSGETQVVVCALAAAREQRLCETFNRFEPPAERHDEPAEDGPLPPVRDFLRAELARRLRRADIDPRAPFSSLGVDSLMAVETVRKLEGRYGLPLHPTLLFEHKTIDAVAAHLGSHAPAQAAPAPQPRPPAPLPEPTGPSHDAWVAGDRPLTRARAPDAPLASDSVEIDVRAAGVSFIDLLAASGLHPVLGARPFVPGHEVAGIVTRVGAGVGHIKPGDPVMALVRMGGYAARCIAQEPAVAPLPAGLDFDAAAAILISGITAILCLEEHARVRPGERVLVQAAAGATGTACVQLARHLGAVVFGTASSEKHAHLRRLGVAHTIDYRARDFAEVVRELTAGSGVDVIVDSLSGDAILRGLAILRPGGRFVEIGAAGVVAPPPVDPRALFLADQSFIGCNVSRLDRDRERLAAHFERLRALVEAKVLVPVIHARVPFAEAERAHAILRARENVGKVVLVL